MTPVEYQMAALATCSPAQLRAGWQRRRRSPVPKISPALLRLALAWEIQAEALPTRLIARLGSSVFA